MRHRHARNMGTKSRHAKRVASRLAHTRNLDLRSPDIHPASGSRQQTDTLKTPLVLAILAFDQRCRASPVLGSKRHRSPVTFADDAAIAEGSLTDLGLVPTFMKSQCSSSDMKDCLFSPMASRNTLRMSGCIPPSPSGRMQSTGSRCSHCGGPTGEALELFKVWRFSTCSWDQATRPHCHKVRRQHVVSEPSGSGART